MKLRDLTLSDFRSRLRHDGLYLRTGPFVFALRTTLDQVADAVWRLYQNYPLPDDCRFADFHVRVVGRPWFVPWRRRQARFEFGGQRRFDPFDFRDAVAYFEWGLNWCVSNHALQYLIVHAAVVERNGRALIIVGRSGAGKSTLCAGLCLGGWRLLSDELALIDPQTGKVTALPRPVGLKNESISVVSRLCPDIEFGPTIHSVRKGTIAHMRPPGESISRMHETAMPAWFLFLNFRPGRRVLLEPVAKPQAALGIAQNCFNYATLGRTGFDALTRAVDLASCCRFSYGDLGDAVQFFKSQSFLDASGRVDLPSGPVREEMPHG